MIDLAKLENVKARGGKIVAACPACREAGMDKSGEHLVILDGGTGKFGCIAHPGPTGHEHRRRIAELVGTPTEPRPLRTAPKPTPQPPPRLAALDLDLRSPTVTDLATIAATRRWPFFAGLEIARGRGLLHTGKVWDDGGMVDAWILTDSTRYAAQARRMDGQPWRGIEAKAKTMPGSCASWPIGCAEIADRPVVLVCEGGPDALAAMTAAWLTGTAEDVAVVAMLGAGQNFHAQAIDHFRGKRIRIVEQNDAAARKAGRKWYEQLRTVASYVDGYEPPAGDKDLSDTLARLAIEHEELDALAEAMRRTEIVQQLF